MVEEAGVEAEVVGTVVLRTVDVRGTYGIQQIPPGIIDPWQSW
jgi:hypothetical protein